MKQKNGTAFGRVFFGPFLYMSVHGPFSAARILSPRFRYRLFTGS
jgi:hypothetical protein